MKVIFWNTDTQKDFMLKKGKLYIGGAEEIIPNLKKITEYARNNNITVVNTADYHTKKTKEISNKPDFKTTFPAHCMITTDGAEFIEETNPKKISDYFIVEYAPEFTGYGNLLSQKRNIIIHKDAFDVFAGNPKTEEILSALNPKAVIVYGVAADVCVNFAIQGLLKRKVNVIVIEDAIKGLSEENCIKLMEDWKEQGVEVVNTDTLIKTLS